MRLEMGLARTRRDVVDGANRLRAGFRQSTALAPAVRARPFAPVFSSFAATLALAGLLVSSSPPRVEAQTFGGDGGGGNAAGGPGGGFNQPGGDAQGEDGGGGGGATADGTVQPGGQGAGAGGDGGAGGANGFHVGASEFDGATDYAGATGGAGFDSSDSSSGGGGGGAGGYGAILSGTGSFGTQATIQGGTGGNGGASSYGGGYGYGYGYGYGAGGNGGDGGIGVYVIDTATFSAGAGTIISGGAGGLGGASRTGSAGSSGNGGAGIYIANGTVFSNNGGVVTGGAGQDTPVAFSFAQAGQAGSGGSGLVLLSGGGLLNTKGSVTGGAGGNATSLGAPGTGGIGVEAASATITNLGQGVISGGVGGSSFSDYFAPGDGGAGIAATGTNIVNSGIIRGGQGGANRGENDPGRGGFGIVGSDLTIVTSGTIAGGLSGDGAEPRADAIRFTGGVNSLTLQAGYAFDGLVTGATDADTFALGGSANATFDASQIGFADSGRQFQGFGLFQKTGSSTWRLTDTTDVITSWQVLGGTLSISSDPNLGALTANNGRVLPGSSGDLRPGSLTLDGGTLETTASFATGRTVLLGNNNGSINTDAGTTFTVNGMVIGDGRLTKTGLGTLILTQANSYAGGTGINAGTLVVGADAALGSSAGPLGFNGGTLRLGASFDLATTRPVTLGTGGGTVDTKGFTSTIGSSIGGPGPLTKAGAGNLSLTGANSYAGGTTLSAGTLGVGRDTALGTGPVRIGNATLAIIADGLTIANAVSLASAGSTVDTADHKATLTGVVSGSGALTKIGSGSLALTSANGYSGGTLLRAGTITVGDSAALGIGTLRMDEGTTLRFAADGLTLANDIVFTGLADPVIDTGANDATESGSISGPGSLTKAGTGTLDLTGLSTYNGPTTIEGGTLLVDGSIGNSIVTINGATTLGGRGTVGGIVALSGATVAPGAGQQFSTLTVTGPVTFEPGSNYRVRIDAAGQTDRIDATGPYGTATINGGNVDVTANGGLYSVNTTYTILTATAGRTGQFSNLTTTSNLAFLEPLLSYGANDVVLGFTQKMVVEPPPPGSPPGTPPVVVPVSFVSVADTPNQGAVAGAIQGLGPTNPLYGAVLSQTDRGARQAFDATSGDPHASAATAAILDANYVSTAIFDRLWNIGGSGLDAYQVLQNFGPTTLPTLLRCYAPTDANAPAIPSSYSVWGQAIGEFGHNGGNANAGSLDRTLGGFIFGIDAPVYGALADVWRFGVAGGYTNDAFAASNRGSTGTYESVFGTLYGGARFGAVDLRFGAGYGSNSTTVRRDAAFPGFFERERSNYGGQTVQGFAEIGYRFALSRVVLEPIAGFTAIHVHQDSFSESGGPAALLGFGRDTDVQTTTLGFRGEATPFANLPIVARLLLGWQHAFGDVSPTAVLAFRAGSTPFTVSGAPIDRDSLVAEAGLDYRATSALTLGINYSGQVGSRAYENAVRGRAEYKF